MFKFRRYCNWILSFDCSLAEGEITTGVFKFLLKILAVKEKIKLRRTHVCLTQLVPL
jgi:hypothetical protein